MTLHGFQTGSWSWRFWNTVWEQWVKDDKYFRPVKGIRPTEFNRAIIETLLAWLYETVRTAKNGPEAKP